MSLPNFAVIIDLNGTLVDTEIAFFKAYRDVFAKRGISFTIEQFTAHWSTKGGKLHEYLEQIHRSDLLPKEQELLNEKNIIFQATLAERALLMPGAKDLLTRLKSAGIKLGLDSSSTKDNIDHILAIFGLKGTFDAVSSGDMEIDEAIYGSKKKKASRMKALADRMVFPYGNVIVIGDAEKDMVGAQEARMKSIAVPNHYTKTNDFSMADRIITAFDKITPEVLENLVSS